MSEFKPGDIVDITIKGARVHAWRPEVSELTVESKADANSDLTTYDYASAQVEVERVAPAEWPPRTARTSRTGAAPMADLTPAETLRTAAGLLRETASRTLGINRPWRYSPGKPSDSVRTESGWEIAYGDDPSNLRWIALASPTLAEPLAAWLEGAADDLGGVEAYLARTAPGEISDPFDYVDEPNSCEHALAVARTILGRTS